MICVNSSLTKLERRYEIVTDKSEQTEVVKKIIVFFDICSSTSILEDLVRTENQKRWRDLLIDLKVYLRKKRSSLRYELYKFLGDGWILLFEPRHDGLEIFEFFEALSDKFLSLYRRHIKGVLTIRIPFIGLTYGLDTGSCIQFVMNEQLEYTGRPLNVACRLQGAIGQHDSKPQNKILLTNNLYATFKDKRKIQHKYKVWRVTRELKNISGGEDYCCIKVERR
jgi:class 3 adenylate cyclase